MDNRDALHILSLETDATIDEITRAYRIHIKQAHPDHGGTSERFILVRTAYSIILDSFKYKSNVMDEDGNYTEKINSLSKLFKEKLQSILEIVPEGVEVSIMGAWLWVSGGTYEIKKELKSYGMKFSNNKKSWYWYEEEYKRRSKKVFTLSDIAKMHGKVDIEKKKKHFLKGG